VRITLRESSLGYRLIAPDGRDRFFQFAADFERLAQSFGIANNAADRANSIFARDYLDEQIGKSIEDPGYFD
jgi:hypothetical protein